MMSMCFGVSNVLLNITNFKKKKKKEKEDKRKRKKIQKQKERRKKKEENSLFQFLIFSLWKMVQLVLKESPVSRLVGRVKGRRKKRKKALKPATED